MWYTFIDIPWNIVLLYPITTPITHNGDVMWCNNMIFRSYIGIFVGIWPTTMICGCQKIADTADTRCRTIFEGSLLGYCTPVFQTNPGWRFLWMFLLTCLGFGVSKERSMNDSKHFWHLLTNLWHPVAHNKSWAIHCCRALPLSPLMERPTDFLCRSCGLFLDVFGAFSSPEMGVSMGWIDKDRSAIDEGDWVLNWEQWFDTRMGQCLLNGPLKWLDQHALTTNCFGVTTPEYHRFSTISGQLGINLVSMTNNK